MNYRPISLLLSLLIVLEKILSYHLSYYLRTHGILTEHQYGFLSGKSTELQLLNFYGSILKSKNEYMTSDITYIDMAKAFNKVSHSNLLYKLDHYGIRGNVHNWLASYLSNRTQCIKVNKTYYNYVPVTSGVAKGSVIYPLLFLIYINDSPDTINPHVLTSLFADDAKLANSFKLHETHDMQDALNSLCKCMFD